MVGTRLGIHLALVFAIIIKLLNYLGNTFIGLLRLFIHKHATYDWDKYQFHLKVYWKEKYPDRFILMSLTVYDYIYRQHIETNKLNQTIHNYGGCCLL